MEFPFLNDNDLNFITVLHQKEEKKDIMIAALESCAIKNYGENTKEYNAFINNLTNHNFLMSHITNLLNTSMFLIYCGEYPDNHFEDEKNRFLQETISFKKTTPTLFQFRTFYIENNEKICSHLSELNDDKKMKYFRRIEPIIDYLRSFK